MVLNSYIGGVGSFLGPGARRGADDLLRLRGVRPDAARGCSTRASLFVLVMMFMPAGLTGLVTAAAVGWRARHGAARVLPLALVVGGRGAAADGGAVFVVEMLQRLFSQDYRALAR